MTRVTHELCITRIGFTHDPYSWGIQLTHDPLKRKIYIKKKITRARHGAPLRGSPTPYGRGSPSRISWPPAGAAMCPPTAYGLRGFALRLPPPPPFRGERVALCRQGCRAYGPAALLSFTPAGSVAATVQRQGFALRAEILTRSVLRASPLRSAAASGFALDPAPTLNSRTAGQPNSRQQAKTARSGVFWPWWYIRQGWGKKTRCRPVSGLSGGISGGRVKGAKRPRLAGAARSAARTRARRGEPLTRPERPSLCEWGQDEGRSPPPCPPSLTAASAGRQGEAAPGAAPLSLSGG